jgi:adenosylcobinamide-phosphate synthase
VIEHSVLAAHRHVFGVCCWFCLLEVLGLGPAVLPAAGAPWR